jgi:lactate permease
MDYLPLVLSILPFLVFIFLLFRKKSTLLLASSVTLGLYTVLAIFYWQIQPLALYISYSKGILLALDIFIIIFGAVFFLELLKDLKIIKNISYYLSSISSDYRVQVIIIAWFFEAFLEGTAGFGTPAAIAIPLLIGIGLTPMKALVVGLLGNSVAGIFGASGTPIKVGFAGLSVANVPVIASIFNFVGILIPVFMLWFITKGRPNRKKEFLEAVPFALLSGFLFLVPSYLGAKYLGQEFPTILGSMIGIILATVFVKLKILTPKNNLSLVKEDVSEKETEVKMSALDLSCLI